MEALRIAVIGLNGIGGRHAQALSEMEGVNLVSVADLNESLLEAKAELLGATGWSDYKEMVKAENLQAIVIATPHFLHAPMGLHCLEAGLHTFVEKPIAMMVSEADRMVEAAARRDLVLGVGHNYRTFPGNQALRSLIEAGDLGDIYRVLWQWLEVRAESYYERDTWRCTWAQAGGGVLMNQTSHDLDLLCWLLGEPVEVSAMVSNWSHKAEIEDTAIANVKFASGALCNLQLSICDRRLNYRQISGEKATVVYQDEKNANSQIPDVFRLGRFATPMRQFIAGGGEIAGQNEIEWEDVAVGGRGEGSTLLESFVSAIRDGSKLITDGVSARRTLELINGIVLSGVRKKVVSLPVDRAEYDELMNELQSGRTQVERVFS